MYVNYKLKNGKTISIYLYGDEGKDYRRRVETIDVTNDIIGEKREVYLKKDAAGRFYFYYDGEIVFIDDYIFMTVNELIAKINSGEQINDHEILATFLNDTDNVGIIEWLPKYKILIPGLGLGIYDLNSEKTPILCELTEDKFPKDLWTSRIKLRPVDENLRDIYVESEHYFCGFAEWFTSGKMKLVNKQEYLRENKGTQYTK